MNNEQRILYEAILELQNMMVFNDLTHLPRAMFLVRKYAYLNDIELEINSVDLDKLKTYNTMYGDK